MQDLNLLWIILPLIVTWSTIGAIIILGDEPTLAVLIVGGFITVFTMMFILPYIDFGTLSINKSPITSETKSEGKN